MCPADPSSYLRKTVLHGAYILGALGSLLLAFLPLDIIISHLLYEDSFYYLKVARNLVNRGVVSFDGISPTNGFHPLWLLVCSGAEAVAPNHSLRLVLVTASILHIVQALVVFDILRHLATRKAAHVLSLFWLFNYRILACNLCGLETPLALLFFLLIVRYVLRCQAPWTPRKSLTLGALMGIAALARFDLLLLACALVVFAFVQKSVPSSIPARARHAVILAACVLAILTPWFAWSHKQSGVLLPNSSAAVNTARAASRPAVDGTGRAGDRATRFQRRLTTGSWLLTDTANLMGLWPTSRPEVRIVGGLAVGLSTLLVAIGIWCIRKRRPTSVLWFLLVYASFHLCYYLYRGLAEVRYLLPWATSVLVLGAVVVSEKVRGCKPVRGHTRRGFVAALGLAIWFGVSFVAGADAWHKHYGARDSHGQHADLLETARWLRANTDSGARIGSFNAGIIGYYSGRLVVNLDGVINDNALNAIRTRTLQTYIEDMEIDYLVDFEDQLESFMNRYAGVTDWRNRYVGRLRYQSEEARHKSIVTVLERKT